MKRKVIELPDLHPGWCSSCNIVYSTAVKDTDGGYCCERCGDHLVFNSEELIERIAALAEQLEQARAENERTGAAFMRLIERIAALTEQLHKCAVAARSCEEAVAIGEPFGDEVKAVLTLRQNADAGFAELAQAKAEVERLKGEASHDEETLEALWQKFGECPHNHTRPDADSNGICACSFDNKEDVCEHHAPQLKKAIEERDTLRAQLEELIEIGNQEINYCPRWGKAVESARARQQERK